MNQVANKRLISIHVLRVEDDGRNERPEVFFNISIHVLRVEDDVEHFEVIA